MSYTKRHENVTWQVLFAQKLKIQSQIPTKRSRARLVEHAHPDYRRLTMALAPRSCDLSVRHIHGGGAAWPEFLPVGAN